MQKGETVDYKWLPYNEFLEFIKTDKFVDRIAESILKNKENIDKAFMALESKERSESVK